MREIEPGILVADSVTSLRESHAGKVLLAGSHGGRFAGLLAAAGGVRAVILNDAGGGAGQACLAALDGIGMAAAVVSHWSARIGDGADMADAGIISAVNRHAARASVEPGLRAMIAARILLGASMPDARPSAPGDARTELGDGMLGCDSASLITAADAGHPVVCGSHGGLLRGNPADVLKAAVAAIALSDAGIGKDRAGLARVDACDALGVPAIAIAHDSAAIGDARALWSSGIVSHANALAGSRGVVIGEGCRVAMERLSPARR